MSEHKLITSSLIDSMNWCKIAPYSWKQIAFNDFCATVRREYRPTPPTAQRGIDFEHLICSNCENKADLMQEAKTLYGSNADIDVIMKMADKCRGGKQQEKVCKEIEVDGDVYFLFGYADVVFPDKIIDIKTCGKYKGESYYKSRIQHHIYSVCLDIADFEYAVADFCNTGHPCLYHEIKIKNNLAESEGEIKRKIIELKDFLKINNLWNDYLSVFSSKNHK